MADARARVERGPLPADLPSVSPWLLGAFARYTRWYLRRHFHALRAASDGWLPDTENAVPKVVYLNHASWWDPLVCLHLWRQFFHRHEAFAPIDARAVEKYAFFNRLGFFGVEPDSPRGAAAFLRLSGSIAARPWSMLWVTPQARFADVRERPIEFKHGLGHLAARIGRNPLAPPAAMGIRRVQFIPLAVEYTYWHERLPEVLLRFGDPMDVSADEAASREPEDWSSLFERRLEETMDALAVGARARDSGLFLNLLAGQAGVGGIYDGWRRLKAALRGRKFDERHGAL